MIGSKQLRIVRKQVKTVYTKNVRLAVLKVANCSVEYVKP